MSAEHRPPSRSNLQQPHRRIASLLVSIASPCRWQVKAQRAAEFRANINAMLIQHRAETQRVVEEKKKERKGLYGRVKGSINSVASVLSAPLPQSLDELADDWGLSGAGKAVEARVNDSTTRENIAKAIQAFKSAGAVAAARSAADPAVEA